MKILIIVLLLLVPACIAAAGTVRRIQRKNWQPAEKWCIIAIAAVIYIVDSLFGNKILFYLIALFQERFLLYACLYLWYLAALDLLMTTIELAVLRRKPRIRDFTLPLVLAVSTLIAALTP